MLSSSTRYHIFNLVVIEPEMSEKFGVCEEWGRCPMFGSDTVTPTLTPTTCQGRCAAKSRPSDNDGDNH